MPMNYSFAHNEPYPKPKKRPHPVDSEHYEPAQKVYISERFAHDLAAMSLNHKDDMVDTSTPPSSKPNDPKRKQSVVVIKDINDFLSDDDDDDDDGMETDYTLPMQKRPGERKYHVPDFVLQNPRAPKSVRELALGPSVCQSDSRANDVIKPKEKHIVVLNNVPVGLTMDLDQSDKATPDSNVAFMDVD
ncbi:hypothetical protein K450DRAFT_232945 [Umbelopsis ramanniana AG]|uniref:Uncharacterized protein n=1 Tax=Umbelopsis ramanniana AG TaxID=1314678 RepID=A0AAD5EFN0_UMBRA|nr:uncharacterized protein K450DRAFT_232945 [Umbelopsis ramanniana AG]KAI8581410.1 hypothetical protein K450DRAFT_232945 [Umbelopsis ramanniana AG]